MFDQAMEIVTTPTLVWLRNAIAACETEIMVVSPFVGTQLNHELTRLRPGIRKRLITRTELQVFASSASDLEAVIEFAEVGGKIDSLSGLHAKLYVIDGQVALVTSANATHSGFCCNWECGVVIDDRNQVDQLVQEANRGFGSPSSPQTWSCADLKSLRPAVAQMKTGLPAPRAAGMLVHGDIPEFSLPRNLWENCFQTLPGWTKLTLEALTQIRTPEFVIDEVYQEALARAQIAYPNNRNRREKVRQQLQRLRELGVVEFLGKGRYRLLMRPA